MVVGRRFPLIDPVCGLIVPVALWMTIDLDYPRLGILRVSNGAVDLGLDQLSDE